MRKVILIEVVNTVFDWDEVLHAVVIADSTTAARRIMHEKYNWSPHGKHRDLWLDKTKTKTKVIGQSRLKSQVVLRVYCDG